jgi:O-antigen biosynthesis protein
MVSVIIPIHNRAHLLSRVVESVRAQTFKDFEILVVDDASTDDVEGAVAALDGPDLVFIRRDQNGGGSATRNTGIAAARGRFVAFLDSDDEWLPTKLELQLSRFDARPGTRVGAVSCGVRVVDPDGRARDFPTTLRGDNAFGELLAFRGGRAGGSTLVVSREVLDEGLRFDENLPAFQDRDFMFRIARKYAIDGVAEPLAIQYRDHGGPYITGNPRNRLRGHKVMLERLAADLRGRPRLIGLYHRRAASFAYLAGEMGEVRHHLLQAWRAEPMQPAMYPLIAASLLGHRAYGRYLKFRSTSGHDEN